MTGKEKRFQSALINLLHNLSINENNNENLNESQIDYYRGILVSAIAMIQAFFNKDFYFSLQYVYEFSPLNSYEVIYKSLPESWKLDWYNISKNK